MNRKQILVSACFLAWASAFWAQDAEKAQVGYRIEASGNVSGGTYAPLWFTANRYGLSSADPNSAYLRAGANIYKLWRRGWRVEAGVDLAGTVGQTAPFVIQQAYADASWRCLTLSVGSKERPNFLLDKNPRLSSGMMVEGSNARPIPQVRIEIPRYVQVPGTKNWLSLKGHLAYGLFTDGRWQRDFVAAGNYYTRGTRYHSKSLMLRIGNRERFPAEFEVGLLMAAQFGGDQYLKNADGSGTMVADMPDGIKSFFKAFVPLEGGSDAPQGDKVNIEGNHLGSWNFALNVYPGEWKARVYLEHYFDDQSQLTWEYGRWKDGHIGVEITPPSNRFVDAVVWEGFSTRNQSGPILYDDFNGSLGVQVSGKDDYYNNYFYQSWQHWGYGVGHPFLPGPAYNSDGNLTVRSTRAKAQHVGVSGSPNNVWSYRVLLSFVRHWGRYQVPLDKVRHQFSSLYEVTYRPAWAVGWSASVALGVDRGDYLGNSAGGMLTIRKIGGLFR